MKKMFLLLLSLFTIVACDNKENNDTVAQQETPQKVVLTKADFAKYVREGVEYDVSSTGVLTFAKPQDMFEDFNDFEEQEVKVKEGNPTSILITKQLSNDPLEPVKEWNERAFIYAIYKSFTYTPVNELIVEAYPLIEQKNGKFKAKKEFALKTQITREKALEVLKKHTAATSFDDLVQLEEAEGQYRRVGVSGSGIWDKFYHNEQYRPTIVSDLLK